MMTDAFDTRMMRLALSTAQRQLGCTAPNPAVGAVIANPTNDEILAVAATAHGGRPHAETEAIAQAGAQALGQTLYVTLEPCAHHGQTPPCAEAIIAAGLKRVVIGVQDPDARVAGKGAAILRQAGLSVQSGVCGREAKSLVRGHALRVTEHRPFVQLKIAMAHNGTVPEGKGGEPVWVTGPLARAFGHQLRAEADAILIGGATLRADNPELTCRLPGLETSSPMRIVVTEHPETIKGSRLSETRSSTPVYLGFSDDNGHVLHKLEDELGAGLAGVHGEVTCADLLAELASLGVTRVLVEGGPKIWAWFCSSGLVDEIVAFVAETDRHDEKALVDARAHLEALLTCDPGELVDRRQVGVDCRLTFRVWANVVNGPY